MRTALLASVVCFFSCDTFLESNPLYCDADHPCVEMGTSCNLAHHRCEATGTPDNPGSGDPLLSSIMPVIGAWAGGTDVSVIGQNFQDGMKVQLNGTPVDTRFVSATELHFTTPPSSGMCGSSTVTLKTGSGQAVTGQASFRYRLTQFSFLPRANPTAIGISATGMVSTELSSSPDDLPDFLISLSIAPPIATFISRDGSYTLKKTGAGAYKEVLLQDFDGDGKIDAVFRNDAKFDVFRSADVSSGTPLTFPQSQSALAFGDANGDRLPDLFAFDFANRVVLRYLSISAVFGFGLVGTAEATGGPGVALATADLDGDRKIDIIAGVSNGELDIGIGTGDGNGTFTAQTGIPVAPAPMQMQALDVDKDGKDELIILTTLMGSGSLVMLKQQGSIASTIPITDVPPNPQQMILRDMDCDGLVDIVLYHTNAKQLDMYLGQSNGGFAILPTSVDIHSDALTLLIMPLGRAMGRPDLVLIDLGGNLVFIDNTSN